MKTDDEFDNLFAAIRQRYSELGPNPRRRESFMAHVRSLGSWERDDVDYSNRDVADVTFPETIDLAYAVCAPSCGVREFIVEGSTQECQYCGGLMFRTEVAEYELKKR